MTVKIAAKMVVWGVFHSFLQTNKFRLLCCHVDFNISRYARFFICKPFDKISIAKRSDTNRVIFVVDLAVFISNFKLRCKDFKLRRHINKTTHLTSTENFCGRLVKQRNLVVRNLINIFCKFTFFYLHELLVFRSINNWRR